MIQDIHETANRERAEGGSVPARAIWTTPSLRQLPASSAEVGATPAVGDGNFTTS
jgi:hypothetical protein